MVTNASARVQILCTRTGRWRACSCQNYSNSTNADTRYSWLENSGFFLIFHWHYSPLWALACQTTSFHFFLSATNSLHLLTPSTSSSIGTTAHCGLWPVEQCPSIFSYLPITLSIFSLPALHLPLTLQPTVGFGLSNNVLPFPYLPPTLSLLLTPNHFPICQQLSLSFSLPALEADFN